MAQLGIRPRDPDSSTRAPNPCTAPPPAMKQRESSECIAILALPSLSGKLWRKSRLNKEEMVNYRGCLLIKLPGYVAKFPGLCRHSLCKILSATAACRIHLTPSGNVVLPWGLQCPQTKILHLPTIIPQRTHAFWAHIPLGRWVFIGTKTFTFEEISIVHGPLFLSPKVRQLVDAGYEFSRVYPGHRLWWKESGLWNQIVLSVLVNDWKQDICKNISSGSISSPSIVYTTYGLCLWAR